MSDDHGAGGDWIRAIGASGPRACLPPERLHTCPRCGDVFECWMVCWPCGSDLICMCCYGDDYERRIPPDGDGGLPLPVAEVA